MKKPVAIFMMTVSCSTLIWAQPTNFPKEKSPISIAKEPTSATLLKPLPRNNASAATRVNPVVLANQMMITFMERMKAGNLKEAKDVALQMIEGCDVYKDSPKEEYRSFSSVMEKRLYETFLAQEGRKLDVIWVQQPVSDGFYFLAMLSFQNRKIEEALENLQKAITWNPVHSPYLVERGYMLLHSPQPDFAMAQAAYLRALELSDNYTDFAAAMRGIGYILVEKNDLEGGLACYLRAKMYDPQDKTTGKEMEFIRSQAPGIGKDLDGTNVATLLSARRIPAGINSIHVKVLLALADELSDPKQIKEMAAVLRRAHQLDPQNESIKKRLAAIK